MLINKSEPQIIEITEKILDQKSSTDEDLRDQFSDMQYTIASVSFVVAILFIVTLLIMIRLWSGRPPKAYLAMIDQAPSSILD